VFLLISLHFLAFLAILAVGLFSVGYSVFLVAKRAADAIAFCAVFVPVLCYWLAALIVGAERAFPGWSQLFSLLPGISGIYLRRAFYRMVLPACGRNACISFGSVFSHPTARLGDNVYVGVGCMLGDVTLEDDALVGSHVSIINGRGQHGIERLDIPVREQPGEYPRITIGVDSWIGDRAIVTADVGKHCVVGAGAVVTKPVPDFAIVVGNPARVHGFREQHGPTPAATIPIMTATIPDSDAG
jgi:acetyltransferase-like isoleucine patch superfamily enzyme